MAGLSFDDALEAVAVYACNDMNRACRAAGLGAPHPAGWWAVVTEAEGAVAYFASQREAVEHRLLVVKQLSRALPLRR